MSRVENVREAVIRLGAARTLAAAMLTMVGARFERQLIVYGLDPGELWCHSCAASIAADLVRNEAKILLPASLGTTGLVHDIGKLVLDGVVAERDETCGFDGATGPELCELERDRFGLDHAEAGAIVASYWQLPPAIVEGIRAHHAAVDDPVGVSIALADTIAYTVARGGAHDELAALRLARLARDLARRHPRPRRDDGRAPRAARRPLPPGRRAVKPRTWQWFLASAIAAAVVYVALPVSVWKQPLYDLIPTACVAAAPGRGPPEPAERRTRMGAVPDRDDPHLRGGMGLVRQRAPRDLTVPFGGRIPRPRWARGVPRSRSRPSEPGGDSTATTRP